LWTNAAATFLRLPPAGAIFGRSNNLRDEYCSIARCSWLQGHHSKAKHTYVADIRRNPAWKQFSRMPSTAQKPLKNELNRRKTAIIAIIAK
jgi:hypothetical protein